MEQALALGSVIPAALASGCCAATRRPNWIVISAMGLMVVAMSDTMLLGERLLPAFGWAFILGMAGMAVLVTQRPRPLASERATHVGFMALLTAAMGWGQRASGVDAGTHGHLHHVNGSGPVGFAVNVPPLVSLLVIICICWSTFLLFRAWSCLRVKRQGTGVVCAERVLCALSLAAMSAMVLAT